VVEGLTFEAEGHVYRFAERVVPSVTTVLQEIYPCFDMVNREVLEAASDFGINVHTAVHLFNLHDLDEDSLDSDLVPPLYAYKQFLADTGFVVRGAEIRVYDPLRGYAGQIDFWGDWKKTTWVIDLKTSSVIPWTVGMQVAAYQNAMPEKPKKRGCLHLKDGAYSFKALNEPSDFIQFQSALNVYRNREAHKLLRSQVFERRAAEYA
jgi:hypothetical protein